MHFLQDLRITAVQRLIEGNTIRASAGGHLRFTPAHRELVADDRPDLYLVHLTRNSMDFSATSRKFLRWRRYRGLFKGISTESRTCRATTSGTTANLP
uniref:Uncharacterized protein n=1 Tax=Caenorhabditis japonica TaxID=281687 RepID=A0A8R1EJ93_CAEJA